MGKKYIIQKNFHQKFKPIQKIGKGLTSIVYSARRFNDDAEIAIKAFNKSQYFTKSGGKGKVLKLLFRLHFYKNSRS